MSRDVAAEVIEVFKNYIEEWIDEGLVEDDAITVETKLADFKFDDLAEIEIQLALEEHFDLPWNDGNAWELHDFETIADAVKYIEKSLECPPTT